MNVEAARARTQRDVDEKKRSEQNKKKLEASKAANADVEQRKKAEQQGSLSNFEALF